MNPANIELHIEELVLHGFAPGERYRIAKGMERELSRLLAEQARPQPLCASREIDRLACTTFQVTLDARADTIGGQLAHTIYDGLKR